jgi:hypothetical protein
MFSYSACEKYVISSMFSYSACMGKLIQEGSTSSVAFGDTYTHNYLVSDKLL